MINYYRMHSNVQLTVAQPCTTNAKISALVARGTEANMLECASHCSTKYKRNRQHSECATVTISRTKGKF